MYKSEFDKRFASGNLPKSIFLFGDCEYLTNYYCDKLIEFHDNKEAFLKLYFDEYDFDVAKKHISQSSLFCDTNILLIKHSKLLKADEVKKLISIAHKKSSSFFIYQLIGNEPKSRDYSRYFNKNSSADFVRFFKPNFAEAINILTQRANELNIKISSQNLQHLYLLQNENLLLCMNELEKFTLKNDEITNQDIESMSYGLGHSTNEQIIEAFLSKKSIKEKLIHLLESSPNEEVSLLNNLQNHIYQLFLFRSYISIHQSVDSVEILGYRLPPLLQKQRVEQANRLTLEKFGELLRGLSNIEYELKTNNQLDKSAYLISSLIKLQTKI
jgi:DNA polymerase-3 subunit delta